MIRAVIPILLALLVVSCARNAPYHPTTAPEKIEYSKALLDVYPGDVRKSPTLYTNLSVAWAGIILSTDAEDAPGGNIRAVTTVEHHYFDWEEDHRAKGGQVYVSPRGEGDFSFSWKLRRDNPDATSADAEKYAAPGKLAIVYGVPESVENGIVILKYRYLRVIDPSHFKTNEFDYGRFGEPFRYIDSGAPVKGK